MISLQPKEKIEFIMILSCVCTREKQAQYHLFLSYTIIIFGVKKCGTLSLDLTHDLFLRFS